MTTNDLDALLNPETLADPAGRLVLADALAEAGRTLEEKLCRSGLPVQVLVRGWPLNRDEVAPLLTAPEGLELNYDYIDDEHEAQRSGAWLNLDWHGEGVGGAEIDEDGSFTPYCGEYLTAHGDGDADYYAEYHGLDLTDEEAAELSETVQEVSRRVARRLVSDYEEYTDYEVFAEMPDPDGDAEDGEDANTVTDRVGVMRVFSSWGGGVMRVDVNGLDLPEDVATAVMQAAAAGQNERTVDRPGWVTWRLTW